MTGRVVVPGPDPERDARVAARRAEDAAKAGRALDRVLSDQGRTVYMTGWHNGYMDGYVASEAHHNSDYGVPGEWCECGRRGYATRHARVRGDDHRDPCNPCSGGRCSDPVMHAEGGHDV